MADILVAEDDQMTRLLLQQSLELDGHHVTTVSNGREALEHTLNEKPTLVLLDLMMPGLNGGMVVQQLRKELEDTIKIIIVTGTAEPEKVPGVTDADLIMSKPIPIEELLTAIRNLIK